MIVFGTNNGVNLRTPPFSSSYNQNVGAIIDPTKFDGHIKLRNNSGTEAAYVHGKYTKSTDSWQSERNTISSGSLEFDVDTSCDAEIVFIYCKTNNNYAYIDFDANYSNHSS